MVCEVRVCGVVWCGVVCGVCVVGRARGGLHARFTTTWTQEQGGREGVRRCLHPLTVTDKVCIYVFVCVRYVCV